MYSYASYTTYGMHICATWRIVLNCRFAAAMRSYVKLLWPLVRHGATITAVNEKQAMSAWRAIGVKRCWWAREMYRAKVCVVVCVDCRGRSDPARTRVDRTSNPACPCCHSRSSLCSSPNPSQSSSGWGQYPSTSRTSSLRLSGTARVFMRDLPGAHTLNGIIPDFNFPPHSITAL